MAPRPTSITQPTDLDLLTQAPLVPECVLRHHHCHWPNDHRFKAVARLLQSIWREDKGLPAGTFITPQGHRRRLGSRLTFPAGQIGANFLNQSVAEVAWKELIHREIGAIYDADRLRLNLLSSQPLAFNVFAPLKRDLDLATRVLSELLPGFIDLVTEILFEHAPARGHPAFTADHTAFDLCIRGRTPTGQRAFIAIELKYAEGLTEALRPATTRYHELAHATGLFITPEEPRLRANLLGQLFRQHCLAQCMLQRDLAEVGLYLFIAPRLNHLAQNAAEAYRSQLKEPTPDQVPFVAITLEQLIEAIVAAGEPHYARALHRRYTDFHLVEGEIDLALAAERERLQASSNAAADVPDGAGEPPADADPTSAAADS
jgi:hypothetical protein